MNIISLVVWTLESNCFIVYTVLIVFFIAFTMFHKNRLEENHNRNRIAAKKNLANINIGRGNILLKIWSSPTGVVPRPYGRLQLNNTAFKQCSVPVDPNPNGGAMIRKPGTGDDIPEKSRETFKNRNERDYPDDDDDPDYLQPAIPEDTPHIPYKPPKRPMADILQRSHDYYELMAKRRTVRKFSTEPIPQEVLDNIVKTAGTAPSGAHTEPWTFVVVQDPSTKEAIRGIVEEEEEQNYARRMSRQWVTDLKPFATNHKKPYLSDAPALILVFRQTYSWRPDGKKRMHYYNEISVAIAAGFLLAAIQYCGLVALTSTPLNCNTRLRDLLSRPANERLELLLPVGKPHEDTTVPDIKRKNLEEILINV